MSSLLLALGLLALQQADESALAARLAPLTAELASLQPGQRPESVARRIAGLPGAPELVLEALSREKLPAAPGSGRTDPLPLDEHLRAALRASARPIGRQAFLGPWAQAAGSGDEHRRIAVIELVGDLGAAADLPLALRASAPTAGESRPSSGIGEALEHAAEQLLARDRRTLPALRPAILSSPAELASRLIRVAGSHPDERTLPLLEGMLGFDARLDLPLISTMERVARTVLTPAVEASEPGGESPDTDVDDGLEGGRLSLRVREYLNHTDRQLVRAAALCLAALQDEGSLDALLELGASSDPGLSGAAFLSLERLSGMTLPRRIDRWQAWAEAERTWTRERAPEVMECLQGSDHPLPQMLAALRELSQHRLGRRRYAEALVPLLDHHDPRLQTQVCRTLAALGTLASPRAFDRLQELAQGSRPEVAEAARTALLAVGAVEIRG